jgi:hypothetical protein
MANSILAYNVRKQICKQASLPTGMPPCSACFFILGTESGRLGGGENIVFALQDHKGRAICMRIQRKFTEGTSYVLNNEVNFRKAIESFGILGFQKVTGYAIEGNSLVHAPFITLEWAHGITLRWTDDFPMNLGDRNKVIHAIARITIDLLKIQKHG